MEVAPGSGIMYLRNSTDPDGPHLEIIDDAWRRWIATIKNGRFDATAR